MLSVLMVNLSDVPVFVGDYFGAYAARSDFMPDGVINLSDVVRMSHGIGSGCP